MTQLTEIVDWVVQPLPEQYQRFLAETPESVMAANGRTLVYGRDDLIERNETRQTAEYCPGNITIGDDSGSSAIMLRLSDGSIHRVDVGAMTPDCFEALADSFEEWRALGFPHEAAT